MRLLDRIQSAGSKTGALGCLTGRSGMRSRRTVSVTCRAAPLTWRSDMSNLSLAGGAAIAAAGLVAGTMNAIVGSGTLVSFPTLLAVGFDKVPANMANTIGLTPGSASAAAAQRSELSNQQVRLRRLLPFSITGAVCGALLVLVLNPKVFARVVPFLILLGVLLVVIQPRMQARLRARRAAADVTAHARSAMDREIHPPVLQVAIFFVGMYGGYFGAGQGVIMMGVLGSLLDDSLPRLNAAKNVLAGAQNGSAAVIFAGYALFRGGNVPWLAAVIIAAASIIGGQVGARVSRHIKPTVLRAVIVVVGLVAAGRLLFFS